MTISITLWDGGYGPSIEDWRALCDQVFSEQGAQFQRGRMWFGDVRDALEFNDARVGCHIWLTVADIDRPLCRLLFELAERARLFVFVPVAPEFLRPPSLRGLDFDHGSVPLLDMDSGDTLFQYFQPQQQEKSV